MSKLSWSELCGPPSASYVLDEHDSCAIVASVRKTGEPTHGNLNRVLKALSKMGHRSGEVNGEGDGCGVLTDIPRILWAGVLTKAGKPAWLAEDRRFFVGHLMIPVGLREKAEAIHQRIVGMARAKGAQLFMSWPGQTRSLALGPLGRGQEPLFWQIAGMMENVTLDEVESTLFQLGIAIESELNVHVASLSSHSVVYKVRGSVETLYHYYPELRSTDFTSAVTLGHARFSTNTTTRFERVQPFSLLGHNGEINTIAQLREEARMLGVELVRSGSDSQDLDRTIATLIYINGFQLIEAIELMFPPILSEVDRLSPELQTLYRFYRQSFGPFAQGPAAIVSRSGDECAFSVDALGLRPLWFVETEKEFVFSSEKGVLHLDTLCNDPRPLSPGEKMGLSLLRGEGVKVYDYASMQAKLLELASKRFGSIKIEKNQASAWESVGFEGGRNKLGEGSESISDLKVIPKSGEGDRDTGSDTTNQVSMKRRLAVWGWSREDRDWVLALAESGQEPIGSLGYDGPLAALSPQRRNLADYCKEVVAVVTNPPVDREREAEHFSTQCILGPRPDLKSTGAMNLTALSLDSPILIEGELDSTLLPPKRAMAAAYSLGSMTLQAVIDYFGKEYVAHLETCTQPGEQIVEALHRLADQAVRFTKAGFSIILLDDGNAFMGGRGWIDPHLAVSVVDKALKNADEPNLRRKVGVVLLSGAVRNLHDLILALGVGADAVCPYLLLELAVDPGKELGMESRELRLCNTVSTLQLGLEKVISTMGIHELRGYGRLFATMGLSQPVAESLGVVQYFGSEKRGLTWEDLDADIEERRSTFAGEEEPRLEAKFGILPRIRKLADKLCSGELESDEYERRVEGLVQEHPIALRHVIGLRCSDPESGSEPEAQRAPKTRQEIHPRDVNAGLTGHDLPFVIASMSFGSQNEVPFKAYAEAAKRLNIIALNGEGGEIPALLGKYHHNRGLQIASGRFGIQVELLNSSNLIEIKIGQGAKPGEGGHLPGRKVSDKVAAARHAKPGVDLISPSNNHDIYSIEDLAQFIEELKTVNPKARVAVKVPVVPGIGIIAVGISKAGANIINLSGFDGGTGAARKHSIKHVGLPAEIGVSEAHRALVDAGLRHKVELWCDGGVRTAADLVKLICLGANRVGFGTMAMIALGCTTCRSCQYGTCHVGIATQIETHTEATEQGLRRFEPRDLEIAVERLVRFFNAIGDGVRELTARLGYERTQDMVGKIELLQQIAFHGQLDLESLLAPRPQVDRETHPSRTVRLGQKSLRRPRNHLTTVISNLVMETASTGEEVISFEDDKVTPVDRALGTHLAGALTRYRRSWGWNPGHGGIGGSQESWRMPVNGSNGDGYHVREINLRFYASSVPGNGLGAFLTRPVNITVEGGAQDGVAKGMQGGHVVVMRGYNHDGVLVDGSVGKGLAYGAIGGWVLIQGDADSRACVRLSGADVVIGGEIRQPLNDSLGYIGARANVKGFLCEYMTAGRVLVLGDPGPWICAGMTGGVLYLQLQPWMNYDQAAIQRRIARSAKVSIRELDEDDKVNLSELILAYADELQRSHQKKENEKLLDLLNQWRTNFVKIVPGKGTN